MKDTWLVWLVYVLVLLVAVVAVSLLSLSVGEIDIPFFDIPAFLFDADSLEYGVLAYIRLPRILLGFAVGGSLSLAGAILQGIYRNPLVEPYTLGISGGASMGVTLGIVCGLHLVNVLFLPFAGFVGAFVTIFLVYTLSLRGGTLNVERMLLTGVMISFIASSVMMFAISVTSSDNIHSILFWTMGSLSETNYTMLAAVVVLSIVGLFVSYLFVMPLNALRLGEDRARYLGFNSGAVIRILFVVTSLLTGVCISVAGIIGFVGLVVPHIVRLWVGSDYRILLVASFLSGSVFLIACDVLARIVVSPNELPIGVITGIVGGTMFIFLLSRRVRSKKLF